MYKILIVEDHPVFRRAINQLLRKALGKVAVSEAGDAPEAARVNFFWSLSEPLRIYAFLR